MRVSGYTFSAFKTAVSAILSTVKYLSSEESFRRTLSTIFGIDYKSGDSNVAKFWVLQSGYIHISNALPRWLATLQMWSQVPVSSQCTIYEIFLLLKKVRQIVRNCWCDVLSQWAYIIAYLICTCIRIKYTSHKNKKSSDHTQCFTVYWFYAGLVTRIQYQFL